MTRDKQKAVDTAVQGRLSTRNRSENGSSTQGYEDFNTMFNTMFKFGNDGGNDSRLGVKSLSNTHAKCVMIGRKSTAKCQ